TVWRRSAVTTDTSTPPLRAITSACWAAVSPPTMRTINDVVATGAAVGEGAGDGEGEGSGVEASTGAAVVSVTVCAAATPAKPEDMAPATRPTTRRRATTE